jgi:DNA-binding MarR family transcriptional regulator
MVASGTEVRLEDVAHSLFSLITRFCLAGSRGRRRSHGLKEVEFLTLAILHRHETRIVGDIQRLLGVLPAQMSRIIRALEDRDQPLIACRINPHDKRKINVCLTPSGERAFLDYCAEQVRALTDLLSHLSDEERDDLVRLLDKLEAVVERRKGVSSPSC